ncbi:MAG: hypothetical protein Q8O22_06155 [Candidatus Omnitrophota bacterium]|nr:hypothetical protein [Candidatus Omnitrophota bacterium]
MYNWSVDLKELKKDKEAYTIWRLQQLINYGLAGERLSKRLVKKYWDKLYLDPPTKRYLKFLLWPKKEY